MTSSQDSTAPCYFDQLPNELQDMVFSYCLDWNLEAFTRYSPTRASAMKALWPFFCQEHIDSNSKCGKRAAREDRMKRYLSKPVHMRDALQRNPKMATGISEISIVIPMMQTKRRGKDARVHEITPSHWLANSAVLDRLLLKMTDLRKLRCIGLSFSCRKSSSTKFSYVRDMLALRTLPKHVDEVYIEDELATDHYAGLTTISANTSIHFDGCHWDNIKILHLKNVGSSYLGASMRRCAALREFRLDLCTLDGALSESEFRQLFHSLGDLRHLKMVDLRHPYSTYDFEDSCTSSILTYLSRIKILRIPLLWFPYILEKSSASNYIQFELLFDRDAAVSHIVEEAHEWVELGVEIPRHPEDGINTMDAALEMVVSLGQYWDEQRSAGVKEMRHVRLVECNWNTGGYGAAWYDYEDWVDLQFEGNLEYHMLEDVSDLD